MPVAPGQGTAFADLKGRSYWGGCIKYRRRAVGQGLGGGRHARTPGEGAAFWGCTQSHPHLPMGLKSTLGCETTLWTTSSPPCKVKAESWRGQWLGASAGTGLEELAGQGLRNGGKAGRDLVWRGKGDVYGASLLAAAVSRCPQSRPTHRNHVHPHFHRKRH